MEKILKHHVELQVDLDSKIDFYIDLFFTELKSNLNSLLSQDLSPSLYDGGLGILLTMSQVEESNTGNE